MCTQDPYIQRDREEDEMPLYSLGSLTREKEMEEALLHYTSTVSYKNVSSFAKPIRYFGKQVSLEKSNLCCSTDNFSLSFFFSAEGLKSRKMLERTGLWIGRIILSGTVLHQ